MSEVDERQLYMESVLRAILYKGCHLCKNGKGNCPVLFMIEHALRRLEDFNSADMARELDLQDIAADEDLICTAYRSE